MTKPQPRLHQGEAGPSAFPARMTGRHGAVLGPGTMRIRHPCALPEKAFEEWLHLGIRFTDLLLVRLYKLLKDVGLFGELLKSQLPRVHPCITALEVRPA